MSAIIRVGDRLRLRFRMELIIPLCILLVVIAAYRFRSRLATASTLQDRHEDLIAKFESSIVVSSGLYYINDRVRDCISEVAKREGQWSIAPAPGEWLSQWQRRAGVPAPYMELSNILQSRFQGRLDELSRQQHEAQEHRRRQEVDKLLERYNALVERFFTIAERRVSVIDEYGDEQWDLLPNEIQTCAFKILQREGRNVGTLKEFLRGTSKATYEWREVVGPLQAALDMRFRDYHANHSKATEVGDEIRNLSGVEFEAYVARILKENGFEVCGTPATGDQGADLIANNGRRKIIVQVKRYQSAVGNSAVQEVVGAVRFYGGDQGWVITNSTFTSSAKALAQKNDVMLIDGKALRNIGTLLDSRSLRCD